MIYLPLMKRSVWEVLQLWQRKELSICAVIAARKKQGFLGWQAPAGKMPAEGERETTFVDGEQKI